MSELAPLVVISGAQAAQINYEHEGAGSLSIAISRSVDKLNTSMTYRGFFAQIIKEMTLLAPKQKPVIEGNIDRKMFGGHAIEQAPFYRSFKVKDKIAFLHGGKLNGIFKDTVIAAYPIGTTTPYGNEALAIGKAIISEGNWCKVEFDKQLELTMDDYWFFVTEKTYGDIKVCVKLDINDKTIRETVSNTLCSSPLINISKESHNFILQDGNPGTLTLIRSFDNSVFAENIPARNNYAKVLDTLKTFARGTYMKNLELTDPKYNVVFEFIPVRFIELPVDQIKIVDTLTIEDITEDGVPVIKTNALIGIIIKVSNIGTKDAYYSIIDIQPDGRINGILPAEDRKLKQSPADFKIAVGQSYIAPGSFVRFYPPYGMEIFKLFASKEPIDFTPILTNKAAYRNYKSQLEMLFDDGYTNSARGDLNKPLRSNDMESSTSVVGFEIR
ncbi:MAG: hypothetical protein ACI9UJ_002361 [bacterium]|jgi:hypothetical protein